MHERAGDPGDLSKDAGARDMVTRVLFWAAAWEHDDFKAKKGPIGIRSGGAPARLP
jgi:hypothetical protein